MIREIYSMGRDTVGAVIQHVVWRLVYCRNACPTTGRLLVNPWGVLASRQCCVKAHTMQTLFHHRHIYVLTLLCLDSSEYWRISVGKCAISANVATKYCFSIYVHDKTNGVHRVFITSYYSYKTWLLDSVILSLKLTRVLHSQRFFLPSIFQFFCFHVFTVVSRESFSWKTIVEHTYPSDGSINWWN